MTKWNIIRKNNLGSRGTQLLLAREIRENGIFIKCEIASMVEGDVTSFMSHRFRSYSCPNLENTETIDI